MGVTIDTDVFVPMRDGVTLATDRWRPHGPGPWRVLLARTPCHESRSPGPWRLPPVRKVGWMRAA